MLKRFRKLIFCSLLAIIAIIALTITAVALDQASAQTNLPTTWVAKFEPSGTHIRDDVIKVRMDFYAHSESKTFNDQYVEKYDRELTEEEEADPKLAALVPTHKELNPTICVFIKIRAATTREELASYILNNYGSNTLRAIDDTLSVGTTPEISLVLKDKYGFGEKVSAKTDIVKLVDELNLRFAGLEVELTK